MSHGAGRKARVPSHSRGDDHKRGRGGDGARTAPQGCCCQAPSHSSRHGRDAEPAAPCAGVVTTTDVDEATQGVEVAVMVGGFPRKAGMERKDVMAKNVSIYKSQASSLEKNAAPGVKASVHHALCAPAAARA